MKLTILERQLNEGPGAGYTIHVDGLSLFNIKSARVTEYVEEDGWFVDVDGTCTIDNLNAESYYYGTGIIHDVDARIKKIWVNWYWVDEYNDLNNMSESELCDFITEYAHDRLSDADFETVYGGGWLHSTYDGTIDAVDSERGDIDLVITDQGAIDYIDTAVQGENYAPNYMVTDELDGVIESFDNEEDAIAFAKEELKTGKYESLTVEFVRDWYDYTGDYVETWENPEVVWQGDYEYED